MKNQQVFSPIKVAIVTFQISPFIENEQQISSLNEMRKSSFLGPIQIPISAKLIANSRRSRQNNHLLCQ